MIRSETQIQIIGLFQSGKSLVDIDETCDCSTQQVRRLLKAAGIYDGKQEQSKNAIRNANNRKGKNNIAAYVKKRDTIVSLYEQGKTVPEIMEETYLSRPTVVKVLRAETDYKPPMGRPKKVKQQEHEAVHETE